MQTIVRKIKNQAGVLRSLEISSDYLTPLHQNVKSGDSTNCEATAATYYWKNYLRISKNLTDIEKALHPIIF